MLCLLIAHSDLTEKHLLSLLQALPPLIKVTSRASALRHQVPCVCMGRLHHIPSVVSVNHTHTYTLSLHSIASMGDGWENHSGG